MLHMVTHMRVVLSEVAIYGRNDSISKVETFTYCPALNTDQDEVSISLTTKLLHRVQFHPKQLSGLSDLCYLPSWFTYPVQTGTVM
jgi:hypothetical protein